VRTTKACPDCGEPLASVPWVSGVVWECSLHGVRDWWFEPVAPLDAPAVRRADDSGLPGPRLGPKLDTRDRLLDTRGG